MRFRRLGRHGPEVSELVLGSWLTYGVSVPRERAAACLRTAFALGINMVDTANMYGRGAAESLLGDLLRDRPRDSYLLATKVYFPMSPTDRGLSREQIHKQLDASLRRLRVDHIDLYQCHRYDGDVPLEETMDALGEVVAAGKVRFVGVSRWTPKQIRAGQRLLPEGVLVSNQPPYSMLSRKPERRLFPKCAEMGIGQLVYSPLAQGVLSGKYLPDRPAPEGSRGADPELRRKSKRFQDRETLRRVQALRPIASDLGLTLPQLALAWVLRDPGVSAAIVGASRPEQLEDNAGAVGVGLDDATLAAIDDALLGTTG